MAAVARIPTATSAKPLQKAPHIMEVLAPAATRRITSYNICYTKLLRSDFRALREGYVSVTPLHLDLTNYTLLEDVRRWNLGD